MRDEFLGKPFRATLTAFIVLFGFSLVGYFGQLSLPILIALCLFTGIITFKKLEHGLALAFLELLSNAHGYILYASLGGFRVSARMMIFVGIFLGWGIALLLKRTTFSLKDTRLIPFIPMAIGILIGGVVGISRRSLVDVFQDGNAYLYFLYLIPVLSIHWDSLCQRVLLQMMAAATVFTAGMSLFILYAFTHLSESFLRVMYVYLRDIRFAEMTNIGMGMYRIFEQTQIFAIVFGFILLERVFRNQTKNNTVISTVLLSTVFVAILIGMSRSFLFGFLAALILLSIWLIFGLKTSLKQWLVGIGTILSSAMIAVVVLYGVIIFPFPHTRAAGEYLTGVFGERATGTDVAVSSRWNLLHPMLDLVKTNPVLGSGFGQSVTFITDDPRIRAMHPDGTWTTTSMEWGWLELWLKMGIFGPIGFSFLFFYVLVAATKQLQTEKAWLAVWVLEFMTFLFCTHFFSPYLNHPIGIGLILLAIIFLPGVDLSRQFIHKESKQKTPQAKLAASYVTSSQK